MSLINKEDLIAEYDRVHQGPPGAARKLMEKAETVEAIPVPWIEAEIKKLRDMDNGFASLSAGQIEAMLNKWRKEQKG